MILDAIKYCFSSVLAQDLIPDPPVEAEAAEGIGYTAILLMSFVIGLVIAADLVSMCAQMTSL